MLGQNASLLLLLRPRESWGRGCTPVRFLNGFGMKVAKNPCLREISLAIKRKKAKRSAIVNASLNPKPYNQNTTPSNLPMPYSHHPDHTLPILL